jgi:hypothetical protein
LPNFCPDCGTKLATPNPNFCPNCGKVLGQKKVDKQKSSPPQACAPSVHELGTKLEKCVEEILIGMGFQTEWRQRIRGTSGVLHEIDVVAKKGKTFWAVECKNWKCPVGKELIGGFHSKLQDLGSNWNGIFVSYQGFTEPAEEYAEQFNIKRWDTDHLKEEWLAVSIGRAEYATIGKKITVKNALPLRVDFSQASKINLLNGNKTSASGLLSYTPYYSVDYSYHAAFKDPTREKHTFNDSGKVFVNALDCSVLNPPLRSTSTLKRTLNLVLSKDARQNAKRTTINCLKTFLMGFQTRNMNWQEKNNILSEFWSQ